MGGPRGKQEILVEADQRGNTGMLDQPSTIPAQSQVLCSVTLENNYCHSLEYRRPEVRVLSPHQVAFFSEKKKRLDETWRTVLEYQLAQIRAGTERTGQGTCALGETLDTALCSLFSAMALIKHNLPSIQISLILKYPYPSLQTIVIRGKTFENNSCGNFLENPLKRPLIMGTSILSPFR